MVLHSNKWSCWNIYPISVDTFTSPLVGFEPFTFTSSFMDSSYLLKLLSFDASKSNEGTIEKLSDIIKKSSFIIINIGLIDFDNLIKIDETNNILIYDEEMLYQKSEIFYSNLKNIITHIYKYNKSIDLYVKKISYHYYINNDNLLTFYSLVNENIQEIVTKQGGNLVF